MRVFSAISAALAIGSAAAFMPSFNLPKGVEKALVPAVAIFGSAPMIVPPAHADGAVSAATVTRAGVLYGPRVIGLKTAAEKGDFAAFEEQDGAARLFNSGAFAMNRPLKKQVQAAYADVQKAVKAKDAAALKTAWATYFKTARLDQTNPFKKGERGQTVSSDFSPFVKNENF